MKTFSALSYTICSVSVFELFKFCFKNNVRLKLKLCWFLLYSETVKGIEYSYIKDKETFEKCLVVCFFRGLILIINSVKKQRDGKKYENEEKLERGKEKPVAYVCRDHENY